MKFLVLSRCAPDDFSGGAALRIAQNLYAFGRLGTVDVLTVGLPESAWSVPGVRHWEAFGVRSLSKRRRLHERFRNRLWPVRPGAHPELDMYHHREVAAWLTRRLRHERYDAVVMEELVFCRYARLVRLFESRVVYDAHNIEGELDDAIGAQSVWAGGGVLASRVKRWLLRGRMRREERRMVRAVDAVWCCSRLDADGIQRLYGPLQVPAVVIPNAIDVQRYAAIPPPIGPQWESSRVQILFVGSFGYPPNEAAALRLIQGVLPTIRAMGREAELRLVGRSVTERMRAAAAGREDVALIGEVESVLPVLAEPSVVVLPIDAGGGTRLKVLEAFAARRPVVSSRKGAEGINARDGEELLFRETDQELAEAACRVWCDSGLRERLCRKAHALVEQQYSWAAAARTIEAAMRRLSGDGRA